MAFLRSSSGQDSALTLRGHRVWMRAPLMADYVAWAELRAMSRDHLTPWEPQWQRDELSRSSYRRRVRHYQREAREDLGYAFLIFSEADDQLVGGLTLSNVRRGVTQAGILGYWIGKPFIGRGYMTEAVRAAVGFAFDTLHLHRLEAATMPSNVASIRVLEHNGFRREGFARQLLKINGVWEDHLLHGLLSSDERGATNAEASSA
ncbi:MAG: GNAT family N-acetyltransferase [Hyphomicrobium sp.]|jgi:ribosomal-protein-alanine N-acetyltransferase